MQTKQPSLSMHKSIEAIASDYILSSFVGLQTKIVSSQLFNLNFIFWLELNYRHYIYEIHSRLTSKKMYFIHTSVNIGDVKNNECKRNARNN